MFIGIQEPRFLEGLPYAGHPDGKPVGNINLVVKDHISLSTIHAPAEFPETGHIILFFEGTPGKHIIMGQKRAFPVAPEQQHLEVAPIRVLPHNRNSGCFTWYNCHHHPLNFTTEAQRYRGGGTWLSGCTS